MQYRVQFCRYYSLLEVMVASAILTILLVGLGGAMTGSIQSGRDKEDSVIAYKAAEQALENLLAQEWDEMHLTIPAGTPSLSSVQVAGNVPGTFFIGSAEHSTQGKEMVGFFTKTDCNWSGLTNKAYRIEVMVVPRVIGGTTTPNKNSIYLSTVRVNY